MKPVVICSLVAALSIVCSVAKAQQFPSQVGEVTAPPGAMTAMQFAQGMVASDAYEIEAGKLAARSGAPAIQDFGRQMMEDHSRSSRALKAVLDHSVVGGFVTTTLPELDPRHKQMFNDLEAAHGSDFDRLYMRQQVMAHREAIAVLEGYIANGRDRHLRRFARDTLPVVQGHLRMLRDMRADRAGG